MCSTTKGHLRTRIAGVYPKDRRAMVPTFVVFLRIRHGRRNPEVHNFPARPLFFCVASAAA